MRSSAGRHPPTPGTRAARTLASPALMPTALAAMALAAKTVTAEGAREETVEWPRIHSWLCLRRRLPPEPTKEHTEVMEVNHEASMSRSPRMRSSSTTVIMVVTSGGQT